MNLTNDDNCTVNFDKLNDPEESAKLMHLLKLQKYKRNIIEQDEFNSKYKDLFTVQKNMNVEQLRELSAEYMSRIDPYTPVFIVKSLDFPTVEELLAPSNLVLTLPAIWNKIGVVNNLGEDGVNIMQAFNNLAASDVDDRFDRKKQMYTKSLGTVIQLMSDQNKLDANKAQAQAMAEDALRKSAAINQEQVDTPQGEELSEEFLKQYEGTTTDQSSTEETEEFL